MFRQNLSDITPSDGLLNRLQLSLVIEDNYEPLGRCDSLVNRRSS